MEVKQINYKRIAIYAVFCLCMLFLRYVGTNNEPLDLAVIYALTHIGFSPIVFGVLYILLPFLHNGFTFPWLYVGQAVIFSVSIFLERNYTAKTGKKNVWWISMLGLVIALIGYVLFAPFQNYSLPFVFVVEAKIQKLVICSIIILLSAIFSVGLKALLQKFLKRRLQLEEILFCITFYLFLGIGICRFLSINAYLGVSIFILLLFSCATKDSSCVLCAFVLALPPVSLGVPCFVRFFLYGVTVTLFSQSGRLFSSLFLLVVFFVYGYFDGLYLLSSEALFQSTLAVLLPCVFFILIPTPMIKELENKLIYYREKHLSRIAINRNRALIGEQLYEISAVFREIQSTFLALGTTEAEEGAKEYIQGCVIDNVCKRCTQYKLCKQKGTMQGFKKLIDVGCLKGKVNLMDVPKSLASECINQSGIMYAVNQQIVEYRKYMTEMENAKSGRLLLAGQAQGVSEILRNLALEQSEPLKLYTEKEKALSMALLSVGIVCSELLVSGEEDNITFSLITYGNADVKKIAKVACEVLKIPMMISQKIALSQDKFCCILRKKPTFDACFGVATLKKEGEVASGDTHSVIRIDERRFLVALADGMGSGAYARKISESTLSLLESFYRAKMPPDCVLSTINKLLTFSKEESFACVDIAVVDLDDGRADIVKIGSPVGFIISGSMIKVLEGGALPLGILDSLTPDTASYTLEENDVILFLSDGITGAFGSTTDLYETLKALPYHNPQQLADLLLEKALAEYGGVAKDDMTAVAVRLFKKKAFA